MAKVLVEETNLTNIANSIREKTGTTDTYKPSEMASAISGIQSGGGDTNIEDGLLTRTLDNVSNSRITTLPSYVFYGYTVEPSGYSVDFDFPNVTTVGTGTFGNATIRNINLPSLRILNYSLFEGARIYGNANLPNAVTFRDKCMSNVLYFKKLEALNAQYIFTKAFLGSSIETFVFGNTVPTLNKVDAFSSTTVSRGTGYIYVPDDLVDDYKSATNWSTYADQIKPISEMPTE